MGGREDVGGGKGVGWGEDVGRGESVGWGEGVGGLCGGGRWGLNRSRGSQLSAQEKEKTQNNEKEEHICALSRPHQGSFLPNLKHPSSLIPRSLTTAVSGLGTRQSTFEISQEIQGVWVVRSVEEATLPVPHSGAHHAERWLSAWTTSEDWNQH